MLTKLVLKNKIHLTSIKRCTIYPPMGDSVHLLGLRGAYISELSTI